MSDESSGRVTVALVSEQIKGLERLTNAGFESLQRQMDDVRGMPIEVATLRGQVEGLDKRVTELEETEDRSSEWKRGSLPMIFFAAIATMTSIALLITNFH